MDNPFFSLDPKSFVNQMFQNAPKQGRGGESLISGVPIDLSAGGEQNFSALTKAIPAFQSTAFYSMPIDISPVRNLLDEHLSQVRFLFLNTQAIFMSIVSQYYGKRNAENVIEELLEVTSMHQEMAIRVLDEQLTMVQAFHQASHAPGSRNILSYLTSKYGPRVSAEQIVYHYIVQDAIQTYMNCILEAGLRTDVFTFSTLSYQFGLLAENVAEVLIVLDKRFRLDS